MYILTKDEDDFLFSLTDNSTKEKVVDKHSISYSFFEKNLEDDNRDFDQVKDAVLKVFENHKDSYNMNNNQIAEFV